MKKTPIALIVGSFLFLGAISPVSAGFFDAPSKSQVNKQQSAILDANQKILKKLYKAEPNAKKLVENSYGYATFSDFGMKIFVAGGGSGKGVVITKNPPSKTYMNMAEVQAGLGIGIKSFQVVFVFENEKVLNDFISKGWAFGGQATAAAKYGKNGAAYQGAVSVADGVWMYQLTDKGLAAEITLKGTKYYKNSELN